MKTSLAILSLLATLTPALAGVRVVDGDTLDLDGMPIRILQIDTPETFHSQCDHERQLGLAAKARLQGLIDGGVMTFRATGYDRFSRVLAYVQVDGIDVGETLLKEGYALPYRPGPKAKAARLAAWCNQIQ